MRVAHICTRFSRLSETFIYDLIVGLERVGMENHVLAAARLHAAERPFERVSLLPVPLWQQAGFVLRKRWQGVYRFPLPRQAARQALATIRPGVVLAHFGGTGAAVAPVTRELGLPLVVVFHAFDLFTRPFHPGSYRHLWASGARAVAVSEHGRRRLHELGCPRERIRVIHCGVDHRRFVPRSGPRPAATGVRLVALGRLTEKKGYDDLLRALALLRSRLARPVSLDVWGEGPLRRRLGALAGELGVRDAVSFRGGAASASVPALLHDYDLFVQPSRTARDGDAEGIPVTLLEAQAAGLPVVATHHAGIPEGVPPANRYLLAREGDAGDLAGKLLALAALPASWQEVGQRGRAWVMEQFTLDGEVAAYRRLFEECTRTCP